MGILSLVLGIGPNVPGRIRSGIDKEAGVESVTKGRRGKIEDTSRKSGTSIVTGR